MECYYEVSGIEDDGDRSSVQKCGDLAELRLNYFADNPVTVIVTAGGCRSSSYETFNSREDHNNPHSYSYSESKSVNVVRMLLKIVKVVRMF